MSLLILVFEGNFAAEFVTTFVFVFETGISSTVEYYVRSKTIPLAKTLPEHKNIATAKIKIFFFIILSRFYIYIY